MQQMPFGKCVDRGDRFRSGGLAGRAQPADGLVRGMRFLMDTIAGTTERLGESGKKGPKQTIVIATVENCPQHLALKDAIEEAADRIRSARFAKPVDLARLRKEARIAVAELKAHCREHGC